MLLSLSPVLRGALPVLGIVYLSNFLDDWLGILLWQEQVSLAMVGLTVADILLTTSIDGKDRRGAGREKVPLLDAALVLVTLGLCGYIVVGYENIVGSGYLGDSANLAMAAVLICLVAEATRRNAGWPMILLLATFFAYGLTASKFGGFLQSRSIPAEQLVSYMVFDPNAMLGPALSVVVTTVMAFVLFGSAIFKLGGGELFIGLALSAMGRFRGGAAKNAVLASSLFGSISGSAVANVVTTGIITIPLIKKSGYRAEEAGAIEAVASTGGQILPPIMGAAAFVMANNLGIAYNEVAQAALVPALLFYLCIFMQCHLRAFRRNTRALTEAERPKAMPTLIAGWPFLIPLVVLIVLLFGTTVSPIKAALSATAVTVVAAFLKRETRPGWRKLVSILEDAGKGMLSIVPVVALANMLIGILSVTGLSFTLSLGIVEAAGGSLPLLLALVAGAAIVLGMGMPTTAVYIVLATLLAPAMINAGVTPMAAHMYVLYYGALSMITPPVCLAAFAGAAIAGGGYMRTGWEAVRLGLSAFLLPPLFVYAPSLLLAGDPVSVAIAIGLAVAAIIFLAAALEGHLILNLGLVTRLILAFIAVGFAIAVSRSTDWATVLAVLAIAAAALAWLRRKRRGNRMSVDRIAAEPEKVAMTPSRQDS